MKRTSRRRRSSRLGEIAFIGIVGSVILILIGLLASCFIQSSATQVTPTPTSVSIIATATSTGFATIGAVPTPSPSRVSNNQITRAPDDTALKATLAGMTLQEKLAQMLMAGFRGQTLAASSDLTALIRQYRVGGILLNTENARDPKQIALLTAQAQTLASQAGVKAPLFVSINHEGGIVVRIASGVTGFPGQMALGATRRADYAYRVAADAAVELRALGINVNLAPVLDVNDQPLNPIIGARSFGDSPALVSELGSETIRGFQTHGVIATAKHFPGHGSALTDSHVGLPVINKSLAELERVELAPFKMAVEQGVDVIMTAHIVVPALDSTPDLPATLSRKIITGILRERYNFQGVIATDALGMSAVTSRGGPGRVAIESVLAGADMLVHTGPLDAQVTILRDLATAVQRGEITEARINESVLRILRLKSKYRLQDAPTADALQIVGRSEHQKLADEVADNAITLVKDTARQIPLAPKKQVLVISPHFLMTDKTSLIGDGLRARGMSVTERVYNLDNVPTRTAVFSETLKMAAQSDYVVYVEWELVKRAINDNDTAQEKMLNGLITMGGKPIVVSMHNPASISRLSNVPTFIALYGNQPAQSRAVVKLLTGEIAAKGQVPMALNPKPGK